MTYLWIQNHLHPFIIYSLFGTFIGYALVGIVLAKKRNMSPANKSMILFVPLMVPFFAYGIAKIFKINTNCVLTSVGSTGIKMADSFFLLICKFSSAAAEILTPLFLLSILVATIKGCTSLITCQRLHLYMVKEDNYQGIKEDKYQEISKDISEWAMKLGVKVPNLIVTPVKYAQSFTFGWRQPAIVMSEGLIASLDREELQGVLAHELAHIYYGDNVINWFRVFIRDLIFFSPLAYWGLSKIFFEREKAADDLAVRLTEKPYAFAQALIKVWRLSPKGSLSNWALDNFSPNPGFLKAKGTVVQRVERVMLENAVVQSLEKVKLISTLILFTVTALVLVIC